MNSTTIQNKYNASSRGPSLCLILFCHNQAHFIPAQIDRIIESKDNLEQLIIVDIASCSTIEDLVAPALAAIIQSSLVRHECNIGIVAAMNRVLDTVETDFVHFLAADDWVEPEFYRSFKALAQATPDAGVFSTGYDTLQEDGATRTAFLAPRPRRKASFLAPPFVHRFLLAKDSWFAGHATIMNKARLAAQGGFDEALEGYSDAYAIHSLALTGGALYDPRPLAVKRLHSNQSGVGIFTNSHSLVLLRMVVNNMTTGSNAANFGPALARRFAGRWFFNYAVAKFEALHPFFVRNLVLGALLRFLFAIRYKPWDIWAAALRRIGVF